MDDGMHEVMLRLFYNSRRKKLVVARISFVNQRQGYGTRLFEIMNEFGKKHGYQTLIVSALKEPLSRKKALCWHHIIILDWTRRVKSS